MSDLDYDGTKGSNVDLFGNTDESEYEDPLIRTTYKQYKQMKGATAARRVILQTSDSSGCDGDDRCITLPRVSSGSKDATAAKRPRRPLAQQNTRYLAPSQLKRVKVTHGTENVRKVAIQGQSAQASVTSKTRVAPETHTSTSENHTLKELGKTNDLLLKLLSRMKRTEERV